VTHNSACDRRQVRAFALTRASDFDTSDSPSKSVWTTGRCQSNGDLPHERRDPWTRATSSSDLRLSGDSSVDTAPCPAGCSASGGRRAAQGCRRRSRSCEITFPSRTLLALARVGQSDPTCSAGAVVAATSCRFGRTGTSPAGVAPFTRTWGPAASARLLVMTASRSTRLFDRSSRHGGSRLERAPSSAWRSLIATIKRLSTVSFPIQLWWTLTHG
jgi:hypothetical protein